MFYHLLAFSVVFLNQLCYFHYSKAANTDFVLTFFDENGSNAYLIIPQKSTEGVGLSVCSWIKLEIPKVSFFDAGFPGTSVLYLRAYIQFTNYGIYGITGDPNNDQYIVGVEDCNLKNIKSWFHVCVIMNQTTISFYLNGIPSENYVMNDKISTEKTDIELRVGDVGGFGGNGSYFQLNAFDRVVTAKEAQNMYNCKSIAGDLLAWKDITSKSTGIQFQEKIVLEKDTVPCPDLPPYTPIDCSTGEPLQIPVYPESSPDTDPESSSENSGSTSGDPGSSSGDPGSSSENSGSSSGDPGSSSGDPGSSSENSGSSPVDPGSSSENSGSSSGDPGSSSGNPNPGSDLGNSNSGPTSQNINAGSSPGSTGN